MALKDRPYCVVRLNLINQQFINDNFGETEGDRLIKGFAEILNRLTNDRVFVGRCGHQNLRMHCRSIK